MVSDAAAAKAAAVEHGSRPSISRVVGPQTGAFAIRAWQRDPGNVGRCGKLGDDSIQSALSILELLNDYPVEEPNWTESFLLEVKSVSHAIPPFVETKEQFGGYHIIECKDREEAISLAMRIPTLAAGGSIEVRPVLRTE